MECLLLYLCMVTALHIMVGLERMLDYRCRISEVSLYHLSNNHREVNSQLKPL